MKRIFISLLILLSVGCNTIPTKPFIIIDKRNHDWSFSGSCDYVYSSSNGLKYEFTDFSNKYNIGDTIK